MSQRPPTRNGAYVGKFKRSARNNFFSLPLHTFIKELMYIYIGIKYMCVYNLLYRKYLMGLRLPLCPQQVLRHVQAVKKYKETY